jgi:hypothetical protein
VEVARNLRDLMALSDAGGGSEILVLDIDLGLDEPGQPLRDALSLALRDDGAGTAAIMARALAVDRRDGAAPDPERQIAAEALLRETPQGPDADLLWQEVVIGKARLGRVDDALAMLDAGLRQGMTTWQAAMSDLVEDRLDATDDAALLLLAHMHGADWTVQGSRAGRVRMAAVRRLAARGLDAAADALQSGAPVLTVPEGFALEGRVSPSTGDRPPVAPDELAVRLEARRAAPPSSADRALDLAILSARIEDSRALRSAARAALDADAAARPASRGE